MKTLLAEIGLEPERVEMFNMSAAMAGAFVERANEMVERVAASGVNPLRDDYPVEKKESEQS